MSNEESGVGEARKIIREWYRRQGRRSVQLDRAQIKTLSERAEAEGWTTEQYLGALSEIIETARGRFVLCSDEPAV